LRAPNYRFEVIEESNTELRLIIKKSHQFPSLPEREPFSYNKDEKKDQVDKEYEYTLKGDAFCLRRKSGEVIFDSSEIPFVYLDHYI
jgi:hypothetical protein